MSQRSLPSFLSYLAFLSLTLSGAVPSAFAASATWTQTPGGTYDWNNSSNWSAAFPNATGDTATITTSTTGSQLINLNQTITVDSLSWGNGANPITIAPNGGKLIFAGPTANVGILQTTNPTGTITDTISADIELQKNIRITAGTSTSHKMLISGTISESGGARTVTVIGPSNTASVSLSGSNTFTNFNISGTILATDTLTNAGTASPIGAGSTINSNNGSFAATSVLRYTGAGASTDRNLRLATGITSGTYNFTLESSGAGALNFTNTADILPGAFTATNAFALDGTNTGNNIFSGLVTRGTSTGTTTFRKAGVGTWTLANNGNSYNGSTNITGGTLRIAKLGNGGVNSSIGASGNAASSLLLGNGAILQYTGSGDSTDRGFTVNGTAAGHKATLDSSGTGPMNFTNTASPAYGTTNQTRELILSGTSTGDNTLAANIGNNGTGAVSLTKSGNGRWILSGTAVYTGATTVNAGTLVISSTGSINSTSAVTIASGGVFDYQGSTALNRTVNVNNGATFRYNSSTACTGTLNLSNGGALGGSGNLGGTSVTVGNSSTLAPGNSPGLQTLGSLVLNDGGNYNWQVVDATAAAGTGYDSITLTGTLNLASLTGTTDFNINLWSLASSTPGPDVSGDASNFNNTVSQTWTLIATDNVIGSFDPSLFTINIPAANGTNGFSNALNGSFSVQLSGDSTDLVLAYTAVPEPSTIHAMIAGAGLFLVLRRRRR